MNQQPPAPSRRNILLSTAAAAALAGLVLVVAVLPAEYGIDPLGMGRALGLTALADAGDEATTTVPAMSAVRPEVNAAQPQPYKEDRFVVELRPFEGVEYKYRMARGGSLVYSWKATEQVKFEFHGEPDGAPAKYFESYEKAEGAQAQGAFLAPTTGIHGWYWKNKGANRVTVTLTTAGFYESAIEFRDGDRIVHPFTVANAGGQK